VTPLLSQIFLFDLPLVSCLSTPQHTSWKGERRDQDDIRVLFLKLHKKHPTLDFKLKREILQKEPLETSFSTLRKPYYKVFKASCISQLQNPIL